MDTEFSTATVSSKNARKRIGWRAGYLLASFGIYMVDQSSKAWAVRALRHGDGQTIIPSFLNFVYTENRGIAFGQLQEGGSFGRWFFVVLAIAAAIAVFYYFVRTPRNDDRVLGACALLLAGIAGNLTDRARLGYVIDFIALHAGSWHWPTFNVADASISIGALLLAYDLIFEKRKPVTSPTAVAHE
ncbi:MAG TPA: signal peptidase II [Pyrinomonadaceae bacterium]|jgi:signal peptidase II|nr:signal peptidase II [Pyrinomonadaceae bacterium]